MKVVLALTTLLAFVGCSSLKDRVDTARTANVRKVAIIGFELNQKQPTDNLGIGALNSLNKHGLEGLSAAPEMKTMATKSYETLRTSLAASTGWTVMTLEELKKNKTFSNYVTSMMSGMRTTSMGSQNYEQFVVAGTLDHFAVVNKMDQAKRDAMARALGVDAVVSVVQYQDLDQSWMALGHATGDASFEATTRSSLMAYTPGTPEAAWQVSNVKGKPVSSDKFGKQERLTKISLTGVESSTSSTQELTKTYVR